MFGSLQELSYFPLPRSLLARPVVQMNFQLQEELSHFFRGKEQLLE